MARDRRRWDDDMATVRRAREVHELATTGTMLVARPSTPARPTATA
jgi:hypothetical protein